jgi:glycosyltransferase involved in cell wall biosynthesis
MLMKISVVIPTFNRAQFVVKAIDSVLSQSFVSHEIIVIDDGSTDATQAVLARYAGKVRYYYQENAGVSSARNAGVRQARGEWVTFLDSDDEWSTDYLRAQVVNAKNFPAAVAHLTNAVTIYPDGLRLNQFAETGLSEQFRSSQCLFLRRPLRFILKYSPWFIQTAMLRRDVLIKIGPFEEGLSIAEDIDIIARAALEGPFTIDRRELVQVYRRKETIMNLSAQSRQNGVSMYQAFQKVYLKLIHAPDITMRERVALARSISSTKRALGNLHVTANRKRDARREYRDSLFVYPTLTGLIKVIATILPGRLSLALVRKGRDILPGPDANASGKFSRSADACNRAD